MWIHEGDKVLINKKVFEVKSIFGLYSTSLVGLKLQEENGTETKIFEILEFNKLFDEGFILAYDIKKKKTRSY